MLARALFFLVAAPLARAGTVVGHGYITNTNEATGDVAVSLTGIAGQTGNYLTIVDDGAGAIFSVDVSGNAVSATNSYTSDGRFKANVTALGLAGTVRGGALVRTVQAAVSKQHCSALSDGVVCTLTLDGLPELSLVELELTAHFADRSTAARLRAPSRQRHLSRRAQEAAPNRPAACLASAPSAQYSPTTGQTTDRAQPRVQFLRT